MPSEKHCNTNCLKLHKIILCISTEWFASFLLSLYVMDLMGWIKKNLIEYWIYPPLLSSLQSYLKLQEKNIIDEKHMCLRKAKYWSNQHLCQWCLTLTDQHLCQRCLTLTLAGQWHVHTLGVMAMFATFPWYTLYEV